MRERLLLIFKAMKEIQSIEMLETQIVIPITKHMPDIIDAGKTDGIKSITEKVLRDIAQKKCSTNNTDTTYERSYSLIENDKVQWSHMTK